LNQSKVSKAELLGVEFQKFKKLYQVFCY